MSASSRYDVSQPSSSERDGTPDPAAAGLTAASRGNRHYPHPWRHNPPLPMTTHPRTQQPDQHAEVEPRNTPNRRQTPQRHWDEKLTPRYQHRWSTPQRQQRNYPPTRRASRPYARPGLLPRQPPTSYRPTLVRLTRNRREPPTRRPAPCRPMRGQWRGAPRHRSRHCPDRRRHRGLVGNHYGWNRPLAATL